MTVNQAVRALRKHLGMTQQEFAGEAGISISALNNYERQRMPELRRLHVLYSKAKQAGRDDLAKVFLLAISDIQERPYAGPALSLLTLSPNNPQTWFEFSCVEALARCLYGGINYQDLIPAVMAALAHVIERAEDLENPLPGIPFQLPAFLRESQRRGYMASTPTKRRRKQS
jgi:transcriptional regulator with XRE-family HTH domain